MSKKIRKTLNITRVGFKTVVVEDGVPQFVDHPDAVFSGIMDAAKAERMMRARYGKDAMIVITSIESGQHRYEMDLETFVLNAVLADDAADEGDTDDDTADDDEDDNNSDNPNPVPSTSSPISSSPSAVPEETKAPEEAPAAPATDTRWLELRPE